MKTLVSRFAVFTVLLVSTCTSGIACSCIGSPPACQAAWLQADAVFVGRVYWSSFKINKNQFGQEVRKSRIRTTLTEVQQRSVKIKALEPFVGDVPGWVNIETGMGGGDCGFNFSWFEKYVVYASRDKDGTLVSRDFHLHANEKRVGSR